MVDIELAFTDRFFSNLIILITLAPGINVPGRLFVLEKNYTQGCLFQPPRLSKFETFSTHPFLLRMLFSEKSLRG